MSETDGRGQGSRERFVAELCARHRYFAVIFSFAVVFLLLQVPYLFVLEMDSGLAPVVVLNVVGSGAFTLGSGAVLWTCAQRD